MAQEIDQLAIRCPQGCKAIMTVAQVEDNSIQMKKDLKQFLYQLRQVTRWQPQLCDVSLC